MKSNVYLDAYLLAVGSCQPYLHHFHHESLDRVLVRLVLGCPEWQESKAVTLNIIQ